MVAKVMKQRLYIRYTLRAKKTITLMINELLLLPLLVRSLMSYDKNVIISTMYSSAFAQELFKRTLLLDGGMGTMLQNSEHNEGPVEYLNLLAPTVIERVHRAYLEAGVDIITTNTFSSHAVTLSEYGLSQLAEKLAYEGAVIARNAINQYSKDGVKRFVAGSMGPTNRSLTLDPEASKPSFEEMVEAYKEQSRGLIRGGVDVLLIETIFDLMNAKAAVEGAKRAMRELGHKVDLWLSFSLADEYGRLLTGYKLEDCIRVMRYARPTVISLNCGFGPQTLIPFAERLSTLYDGFIGLYPNAGLPNAEGKYSLNAEDFSNQLQPILSSGILSIIGGCCGTTNEHMKALRDTLRMLQQKEVVCFNRPSPIPTTHISADVKSNRKFHLVGERCNVAGSRLFKTIISEARYEEAVDLALQQLKDGATIIDINVDAPMLNAECEMLRLLDTFSYEAKLVGVPLMIDSSNWDVVMKALNRVSGKLIVNSISLKDGEECFLQKARIISSYGAGVVVMAADEQGQATTYEHRMNVCKRAYKLLTEEVGISDEDIIFDPNVLAICTGVAEHMNYASDLLKTIKSLHELFPQTHLIGGLSNLSFAFRGCEPLRRALHSVFLHHAKQMGLDMVILNPATIVDVDAIPQELRRLLDEAVLWGKDVTTELMEWGARLKSNQATTISQQPTTSSAPDERLQTAIIKGYSQTLEQDLQCLLQKYQPLDIIKHHLMNAMERVGELFGKGELFLPQVIRSAEVMNHIVELLEPHMKLNGKNSQKSKVILATVKGDVHDIGKNICATLLRCNGFDVIDLGVMVEADAIVSAALRYAPSFIGLSGLITPSLLEMRKVISACQASGVRIPILIGGATTSAEHTALHLAPVCDMPVLWTSDASQLVLLAKKLYATEEQDAYSDYVIGLRQQQEQLRATSTNNTIGLQTLNESRKLKVSLYE